MPPPSFEEGSAAPTFTEKPEAQGGEPAAVIRGMTPPGVQGAHPDSGHSHRGPAGRGLARCPVSTWVLLRVEVIDESCCAGLPSLLVFPITPKGRSLPAARGVWGPFSRQVPGAGIVPGSSGQGEARLCVCDPEPGPSPLRVPRALGSPQENQSSTLCMKPQRGLRTRSTHAGGCRWPGPVRLGSSLCTWLGQLHTDLPQALITH